MSNSKVWVDNSDYGDWMVEFIPCKKGPNFSQNNCLDLISCWNQKIDEEAYEILMAVILEPEEKSEEYDFLWQQELWTKDRDISGPNGKIIMKIIGMKILDPLQLF